VNLVPPLPPLTDLPTIFKIYDNSGRIKKDRLPTKSDHSQFHTLETLGDGVILLLIRRLIPSLFGPDMSLGFLKLLEDHGKSNRCLEQLAMDYNLEVWAAALPQLEKKLANFFELWIGSVFNERRLWDKNPLEALEEFFRRIWEIRYRVLQPYMPPRWASCWKLPSVEEEKEDVKVSCREIHYPDSVFDLCQLNLPGARQRSVGFVARATSTQLSPGEQNYIEVFDSDLERAQDLARRLVGSSALRGTKFMPSSSF